MIWPLIEFGSVAFFVVMAILFVGETAFLHRGEDSAAITMLVVSAVLLLSLVGGLPYPRWEFIAGYLVGGFVWVPIFWYLTLKHNRAKLISARSKHERTEYGTLDGALWLPKHPDASELVANGTLWVVAAPVYATNEWINWTIAFFYGYMKKIQRGLAVRDVE